MRYGLCIAAAAAALFAVPATAGQLSTEMSSQGVTVEGPGVGIHVGPDRWHRDHWRERDVRHRDDWRHRHWRERDVRHDCKTVTVRERGPDGTMIRRTRSNC